MKKIFNNSKYLQNIVSIFISSKNKTYDIIFIYKMDNQIKPVFCEAIKIDGKKCQKRVYHTIDNDLKFCLVHRKLFLSNNKIVNT